MAYSYGDLFPENLLRDEVLYLHGLWKQGSDPPTTGNGNFNSSTEYKPTLTHLRPRFSGKLRKGRKRQRKRRKAVASEKEWPCDPAPESNQAVPTGWPEPRPKPDPRPPSAEELAVAVVARAQKNGVDACRRYFSKRIMYNDSDEGDSAGELEGDDDQEEEEVEEWAFNIFIDILTKDNELRRYYEENHDKGDFLCLVCEGSGAKKGRTFGDCAGLVQHCSSAAKIGPKAAHRGLARALCRVVGWKFDRLPMLVLDLEDTLGQMLARVASG